MSSSEASHVYAVVEHGVVSNVIVATAAFAATAHRTVRIDQVVPRPGVGWSYANRRWTPPPEVQLHPAELFGPGPLAFGG